MATRKTPTGSRKKRPVAKRERVEASNAIVYAAPTAGGQCNDLVDLGAARHTDRPAHPKSNVRSGYGDR